MCVCVCVCVCVCKCHSETSCGAILSKQKCLVFKNREQEGKTVPIWGVAISGRQGRYKERV
jgi:hypothetical protein